jgi:hypothetical protein
MAKKLALIPMFIFAGLGVFYGGAKFYVPWYGGNDFKNYSLMVERPLHNDALSPFAYRIVTPTFAHYLKQSGMFYRSKSTPFEDAFTNYDGKTYDPKVLNALIFANFVFLVLAAFFLAEAIGDDLSALDPQLVALLQFVIPALLFLSFSTVAHGFTGLTEGGSVFFVSLLLYLFQKRNIVVFFCVVCLSVLQREIIPLILFAYIVGFGLKRSVMPYLLACGLAFLLIMVGEIVLFPIQGNEDEIQLSGYVSNLLAFRLTRDFVFQTLFSCNLVFMSLIFLWATNKLASSLRLLLPFFVVFVFLFGLGIIAGIGNNLGRILNLATPVLLLSLAAIFKVSASANERIAGLRAGNLH